MIHGNKTAYIQNYAVTSNDIGENIKAWSNVDTLVGFLDLSSGDSKYTTYNSKIQESTHIFICDYSELNSSITAEKSRMIIDNKVYDIMLIDDPMELHKQQEFYLKYTGGQ